MKKILTLFAAVSMFSLASCTDVETGHTGVASGPNGTEMDRVYEEGLHFGLKWLYTDMIPYSTRDCTVTLTNEFLDFDGVPTPITATMTFRAISQSVNKIHKTQGPGYVESKVMNSFGVALKNVVPKYKALQINVDKRDEADAELKAYLQKSLAEFNCVLVSVNIKDVDLPDGVKQIIIEKQAQNERNNIAEKRRLENIYLGQAIVAKDSLNFIAAGYQSKTKKILSAPEMLELKRLEIEQTHANACEKHGISRYGEGNVFGSETSVVKGLK